MNMKNATILLIFLLAVLGLILGVYYTEVANIEKTSNDNEQSVDEDPNGVVTVTLEPDQKNESSLDRYFT